MKTEHKIIVGDSRNMQEVSDESVQLVITSPPYWQLKDYGDKKQIGFDDSYEDYINNINLVWNECHRILQKGCRLCVNIGDQFARSVYYGRYKIIPIRTEIIKFCESAGFDYMGAIIWQKVTTCNTTGGATIMGSYPYPRNGILKLDYEFILIFKKYGEPPKVTKEIKDLSKLSKDEWNELFTGHWNFSGKKQDKHLAMFPVELPSRLIKMFSFVGDTVLDPFLGSGTTTLAAKKLDRYSIGYEINEDFLPVIEQKLGLKQQPLFADSSFKISKQEKHQVDFKDKIQKLPYIFDDPVKFDKKTDPRSFNFGSKINVGKKLYKEYYIVNYIVSPNLMILKKDIGIRLIGIKAKEDKTEEALSFLMTILKGKKVFMKFDEIKNDSSGNLYCYLYLANRTFINAHLLKNNLVDIDNTIDFKFKNRFIKYLKIGQSKNQG